MTCAGFLTAMAAVLLGTGPLPTAIDCRRSMEASRSGMPSFRADFRSYQGFLTEGEVQDFLGHLSVERYKQYQLMSMDTGWFCAHPGWIGYRYIQPDYRFDVTELPLEVRWDGRTAVKFKPASQSYFEIIPPDEKTRQDWNNHFMVTFFQYDLIKNLGPSPDSRRFLLPAALERGGYRVSGYEDAGGVRCVRLDRSGDDTLWLAPGSDWAVVQRRWKMAGGAGSGRDAYVEFHYRNFAPVHGRAMPRDALLVYADGRPKLKTTFVHIDQYTELGPEEFRPTLAPGATWRVMKDGNLLSTVIQSGGPNYLEQLLGRLRARLRVQDAPRPGSPWAWAAASLPYLLLTAAVVAPPGLGSRLSRGHGRRKGGT